MDDADSNVGPDRSTVNSRNISRCRAIFGTGLLPLYIEGMTRVPRIGARDVPLSCFGVNFGNISAVYEYGGYAGGWY
jgi:hypothetical protein